MASPAPIVTNAVVRIPYAIMLAEKTWLALTPGSSYESWKIVPNSSRSMPGKANVKTRAVRSRKNCSSST
jgi:hypothetical protein